MGQPSATNSVTAVCHETALVVRLRSEKAAAYLAEVHGVTISPKTLEKLRSVGGGPIFRRSGRIVVYEREALDEWAAARLSKPLRRASEEA